MSIENLDLGELTSGIVMLPAISGQLSGDYHSTFKGQGVEFDEVRPYIAGDDVMTIDWSTVDNAKAKLKEILTSQ